MKKITRREFLRSSALAGAGAVLAGKGSPVEATEEAEETTATITHSPIVHNHYKLDDSSDAFTTASAPFDEGPCDHDCENCPAYQMLYGKAYRKRCTGTREGAPVPDYFESDEYKKSLGS